MFAVAHEVLARVAVQILGVGLLGAFERLGRALAGVFRTWSDMRLDRRSAGRSVGGGGVESQRAVRCEKGKRRGADQSLDSQVRRSSC